MARFGKSLKGLLKPKNLGIFLVLVFFTTLIPVISQTLTNSTEICKIQTKKKIYCENESIELFGSAYPRGELTLIPGYSLNSSLSGINVSFGNLSLSPGNYTALLKCGNASANVSFSVIPCKSGAEPEPLLLLEVPEIVCLEKTSAAEIKGRIENLENISQKIKSVTLAVNNVTYNVSLDENARFSLSVPVGKGNFSVIARALNLSNSSHFRAVICNSVKLFLEKREYCDNESVTINATAIINTTPFEKEGELYAINNETYGPISLRFSKGVLIENLSFSLPADNYTLLLNVSGVLASENITVLECIPEKREAKEITKNRTLEENLTQKSEPNITLGIFGNETFCEGEVALKFKALVNNEPYNGSALLRVNASEHAIEFARGTCKFSQNLSKGVYLVNVSINDTWSARVIKVIPCITNVSNASRKIANASALNTSQKESFLLIFAKREYVEGEEISLRGFAKINGRNYTGDANLTILSSEFAGYDCYSVYAENGYFETPPIILGRGNYTAIIRIENLTNSTTFAVVKKRISRKAISTEVGEITLASEKGSIETLSYENGELFLRIVNLSKGEKVKVNLTLPFEIPEGYHLYFWKKVANKTVEIPYSISPDRKTVIFELKDGEIDEDNMENGIIVDPLIIPKPPEFSAKFLRKARNEMEISVTEKSRHYWFKVKSNKGYLDVKIVDPANLPRLPKGTNFKYKLMKINISRIEPGSNVDLFITFSDRVSSIAEFWKFSAKTLRWRKYPFERVGESTIKITLQDGGEGDEDGEANGIIIDDSGLSDSWWNTSWLYRKIINITSSSSQNITDFPAHLIIDTQSLILAGKMKSDCSDMRFTWWNLSSQKEEKTDYLLVGPCNTTRTLVWVKVPILYNGSFTTQIAMYYGNNASMSESNANAVFPGIRAYWAFEEGSGSTVNDYSGNGYNGELTDVAGGDAPLWRDSSYCKIGYCIESDDTGDGVNVSYLAVNGLDNVTFEAWIKTADTRWGLISGARAGTDNEYLIYLETTPELRLYIKGSYDGVSPGSLTDGDWHHLAVVRNSDGTVAFYLDGSLLGTVSGLPTGTLSISPNGLWLLQEQDSVGDSWDSNQAFIGLIDDVRIFARSLSQEEIKKKSVTYSTSLGEEEYVAKLNASITTPPEGFIATRYESFSLNTTIYCKSGNCENVYAYPQYVAPSGIADKIIEDAQDDFLTYTEKVNITVVPQGMLKLQPESGESWLNESWKYRKQINLTYNGEGNLTGYTVNITLDTQSLILAGKMKSDCSDIVFSYFNQSTRNEIEIPYWIEFGCNTTVTQIWVRIPFIRNSTYGKEIIYMYYGNPSASVHYDPEDVFDYFVNFTKLGIQSAYGSGQDQTPTQYEIVNNTVLHLWGNNWKGVYYGPITINGDGTQILELYMNGTNTAEIYGVGFDTDLDNVADAQGSTYQFAGSQAWGVSPDQSYTAFGNWQHVYAILNDFSGAYLYFIFANDDDSDANGDVWYKDVRVRKYASPEPQPSVGAEEQLNLKGSGYYISKIFDFGTSDIDFTNVYWVAQTNENTTVKVYTRSSEDNVTWSPWYEEVNDTDVDAPNRRYLQYKVELSTTNSEQTPVFDKIVISYVYTVPAFVTMKSSGTDFTTSPVPYECGELNESNSPCIASWEVTPHEKGNYTLRVWVNSSNSEIKPAQSQWINVSVYERTYIVDLEVEPEVQHKGGDVTISARLLDALSNPIANANVTFTDDTDGNVIGYDLTDSNGYATIVYTIPENASLGYHTIKANYSGNSTLFYLGSWDTVQLKVSSSPKFHEILLSDPSLGTKERERIQANVTDEVGLDKVILYLTYPNGTEISRVMSYNSSTGYYEYTTEELWQVGDYSFYIWANNSDGISNSSWEETFAVKVLGRLDIAVEKDKYKNFEEVRLSTESDEWDFANYTWRDVIYVYSNTSEKNIPVEIKVNTSKLISEGKLNANCSDIRFAQTMSIEELPLKISNPYGEVKHDFTFPITITDKETLSKLSPDGRDVRIFSYQTNTPYAEEPDIPFWVESVSTSEARIWVRLQQLPVEGATLYLYYGNTSAQSRSNYTAVFTEIIGEAGIVYANDTWVNFHYLDESEEARFVFSSIDTYYGSQEAFTRITKVNKTGFHVFIQESTGLDQSHAYENLGWLAVKNGTWVVAGKIWQVGNLSVTGSYSTVNFPVQFEAEPVIISQIQSYVDTTPAKTRMHNPSTSSFNVKIEPGSTSDSFSSYENVAWLAAEPGIYEAGAVIEVGKKYHNQPSDVSSTSGWTSYSLSAPFSSTPAVVAKLMTEYGGDNTHERIKDVSTSGFKYAMEEEHDHDGSHTYEWNGYFAVEPSRPIYGARYYGEWPSVTEQTEKRRVIQTLTTELPYWIEKGCGSENTSIWARVAYLNPGRNTIYMYHGNPNDGIVNNTAEDELRVFTTDKIASYVVLGVQGSALDVASYADDNEITLSSTTVTLDSQQTYTFSSSDVSLGNLLYSRAPVSSGTQSSGDGAPLTPLAFKGKLFVFPVSRYDPVHFDIYALEDSQVQIWVSNPAGSAWSLNDSFSLSKGSATSKDYTGSSNTDASIELTYMINSTGEIVVFARQGNDDYLPLVPASRELYLLPSNYIELAAVEDNTHVTIYYSDGSTPTSLTLNAGEGYTSSSLGNDGKAPAVRIVADKPVFAYQLADSDGTEATPAIRKQDMDFVFVFPQNAEYFVAVTPENTTTKCTLYASDGSVRAGPWVASGTQNEPGKIGYGTGQDGTTYIYKGDKLVCNNSVRVYYEQAANDAETLLYGPKMHRKFVDIRYEFAYEEDKWVNLENNGNETLRGYLWAIVQKLDQETGEWVNIPPAVINDRATGTLREIAPGDALNLTQLWLDYGAWNTSDHENGIYRVYFAFVDPEGNVLYDYELRYLTDNAHFEIIPANVTLVNLTHNALFEHGLEEYETGDNITWVNLTIKAIKNSAINANVYLTLIAESGAYAGFGPNGESHYCGLIHENDYCTVEFDNSGSGYAIPENLGIDGSANYTFKVNVTMDNGDDYINTTYNITVHNIPSTFAASLQPTRIYQNGDPAYYNFSFTNLWSRNLSNVSVRINCPGLLGLTCECLNNPGSNTCDVGNVSAGESVNVTFRISATEDTPQGDYTVNVTLTYINPLGNNKTWSEVESKTLEIRSLGLIEITVYSYPASVTRGANASFEAYANNTGEQTAGEAWLAYSEYPAGWSVVEGQENVTQSNVAPGEIFWNNVTFALSESAELGAQKVKLESGSDIDQHDFKIVTVYVHANTSLRVWVNDTNVSRGEGVRIYAKLVMDNGTAISGQEIEFYDETENTLIGSAVTDASGIAFVDYAITQSALLGEHVLNASFAGNESIYVNPCENETVINVGLKPFINWIEILPSQEIGYGINATIRANITDDQGIEFAKVKITSPAGEVTEINMSEVSQNIYEANYSNTWINGTYSVEVIARDIVGSVNSSQSGFEVKIYAGVVVKTEKAQYYPAEEVRLAQAPVYPYLYKRAIKIENPFDQNLTEYQVNIIVNTSALIAQGKMQEDCDDIRFTWLNATSNEEQEIPYYLDYGCNSGETSIWVKVPVIYANANTTIYMYYGNDYAQSASNESAVFTYSKSETTFYVVSYTASSSSLDVIAFENDTSVIFNGNAVTLDEGQTYQFSASNDMAAGVAHDKPIYGAFSKDVTDAIHPISWAGKRFVYRVDRGTNEWYFYAPFGDAQIKIYQGTTLKTTINLANGSAYRAQVDIADGNAVIIESNVSILAQHAAPSNGYDSRLLYPASTKLYGIPSQYMEVAALEDGTHVDIYCSDGNSYSINLDRGGEWQQNGFGSEGTAPACVVIANKPVGVNQLADSDGTETTTFLPLKELDRVYYFPQPVQYIAIAAPFETTCTLYHADGTTETKTASPVGNAPGKIYFGSSTDGTNIQAGSKLVCSQPVFAYYEYSGTSGGDETQLFGMKANRKYAGEELNYTIEEETPAGSGVLNFAHDFKGYAIVEIQKNVSGSWQHRATLLNDSATNTLRTFTQGVFDLRSVANTWNPEGETGQYRVVAYVVNPDSAILNASKRIMLASYEFEVVPVPLKLNISEIRVYEAPYGEHGGGTLVASGVNTTFALEAGKTYRFEIDVSVLQDSSEWNISEANVTLENLNESWSIDTSEDVWYLNETDSAERRGGVFASGVLKWNTSENNGLAESGSKVTFFFIVNLSDAIAEERGVVFRVKGADYVYKDFDTIEVYYADLTPPKLWQEIYGLNASEVLRGESVLAYARWDEEIHEALIEYNSTASLLVNYTISLPSPNPENWTNYTMETTSLWLLGRHAAKIYARDAAENWNGSLPYLYFDVYGLAYVESMTINDTSPEVNDYIEITCLVKDDTNDEGIENYNVSFYYDSSYIGYALTNASGYASLAYQVTSPGEHVVKCNITNSSEMFYKIDERNYKEQSIFVNELEAPKWHEISAPALAHKGDYVTLAVRWTDNFALDAAKLATNASGSYENVSSTQLSGTDVWANFSYQIPVSMQPGYLAWKQFANDTSGNENVTPEQVIEIWGWAKVSEAFVEPSSITQGNSTVMYCKVVDANYTTYAISEYNVSFYLDSTYLGWNLTNASGWAQYNFTPSSAGTFNVRCVIGDYAEKKYNASEHNEGSDTLTVVTGADTEPPKIVNGNYGLNATSIYRYDPVLVYGQWNEEIDKAWVEYNETSPSAFTTAYFEDSGTPENWTNYTIVTTDSWKPGKHVVKLYANDTSGNINDTLPYLTFEMWGRSAVYWISPTQPVYRGKLIIICQVRDYDTQNGIAEYTVEFYNSTDYLGSNVTNTSGYAQLTIDTSSYEPGEQTFYCKITSDSAKYYDAVVKQASYDVEIKGKLNVTIITPAQHAILERGESYELTSVTKDEFGNVVTPSSAEWYDNEQFIASGENVTWLVPTSHALGETTVKVNVTKAYYDSDEDSRNIYIYGHAKAKWVSPNDGSYVQDTELELTCYVNDSDVSSGIANYPVRFYYNGTLIASALTNASGYASVLWSTAGLEGVYNVSCAIEDNATLYYLATQPLDNTFIEIYVDTQPPEVNIILPENATYAQSELTLNYTASDDHELQTCWYSLDNGANITLPNCENTTLTSLADGTHRVVVYANDSAGNVGYDEVYFTIDTQAPIITIVSPENKTYAQSWVWANVSLNEKASLCWYSLDNGSNESMQNTSESADYWYANVSSLSEGAHSITFYCNDTAGNENSTGIVFTVDLTPPSIALLEPEDNAVLNADYITFKCNASDSIKLVNVSLLTNESGVFEVVHTNTSGVNGNYTFERSVQDGVYLWSCKACDAVHCAQAENRTVIADTQAPNVTIYSPQNVSYAQSDVDLNYTASDLTLQACWYSLDSGENITLPNCENTTLTSLADGTHKVRVYVNDSLGRIGYDEVYFTVDTHAPQVSVISPENNTEYGVNIIDLEYVASDNLGLTWCGYSLDGEENVTLPNCENTTLTGLENGVHNVTVYVRDTAGNENASFVNFSVNSVAPVVNIWHPEDFAYYARSDIDLNYTVEDSDLAYCWYSLDSGANITLPNCENTTLTGLSEGEHVVRVYANDSQSHESYDEVTFYVDTIAPEVSIVLPENKTYNTSSVRLNYSATDANLETCWYSLDNGENITLPNCENTTLTSLADGTHRVVVYANDSAGNVGYDEVYFTIDTQAPIITIVSPENKTYLTSTINVNYTVQDNLGVSVCWYKLDAGEAIYLANCENFTLSGVVDGTHVLTIYANDTASNVNSSSVTFSVDTQGPEITFVPPTPADNEALDYNWTYVNVTTNEPVSVALLEWNYTNGTAINFTMHALTSQSLWYNVTGLEDGTYYYRVYANDSFDHWSVSEARSVRISTTAPVIDIISPEAKTYDESNYIALKVVANKPISMWWFSINGKGNETFTPNTSIAAKPGDNLLYVYANDTSGRVGWASVSFSVNATLWEDYFATKAGIEQSENASVKNKLSIDFCYYLSDGCYLYRKRFVINSSQPLEDFQVNLTVDTQSLILAGKMNATCKDMRFTFVNSSGEYEIPYYIESGCNSSETKIWIRVPRVEAGNTTVYMYYGNVLAQGKSNASAVFESYSASQTCSGSTAGGACPITFSAPSGYEFFEGELDLEAAGDLGYGGEYANTASCDAGETYERFNVTVEGVCYGTYSPGIDGCALTHISTWPKNVSGEIRGKTSFTVKPQVNSRVNADPNSCGFYYKFRANLTAKIRKQGYVDKVYEEGEEARKRNAWARSILIKPVKIARWSRACLDYALNGKSLGLEIYDAGNNMLANCTASVLSGKCCDISNITAKALYAKFLLFTDEALVSPEIYHFNITWSTSLLARFSSYNASFEQRSDTYAWIYDRAGNVIAEGYTPLEVDLEIYENYTYKSHTSISDGLQAEIYNINITSSDFVLEEQIVENYNGYLPENVSRITPIYALNDSALTFEKAKLTIPKNNTNVQYVLHCLAWDFAQANCSEWEFINPSALEGFGENSTHIWFNVSSFEAYAGASTQPDLAAREIIFNVSQSDAVESEPVLVSANISEEQGVDASNVNVTLEIYAFNGTAWLLKETHSKLANISANSYELVNFTWIAKPGTWNFSVTVDPANEIAETNESNNVNSTTYNVSGWAVYYGFTNGWLALKDAAGANFSVWIPAMQEGNLYFADADSDFEFADLMPLNGTSDLEEADSALNMSGFSDSVKALFDKDGDGLPDATACFEIGSRTVCEVPVINSTENNNGNFVTGILWDSGDGGSEYNGTQDLVFITEINAGAEGSYGTCDYEARVPALLRALKGSDDRITIYMEVK